MNLNRPKIDIALERTSFRGGKLANGYVQFRVDRDFPLMSGIQLTFRGVAQSTVQYTQRRQQLDGGIGNQGMYDYDKPEEMAGSGSSQRMAVDRQTVICMQLPIAQFLDGQGPQEGLYQLPFQLPVPDVLPPSIPQFRGNSSMAFLFYTLSMEVLGPASQAGRIREVVANVPVKMETSLPDVPDRPPAETDTQSLSFMGIIGKGSVTLEARVERGAVAAGEQLGILWRVINDSGRSAVKRVAAKLVKKSQITAKGQRNKASTETVTETSWEVFDEEEESERMLRAGLDIPLSASPSAHAEVIDVSYLVVLEADTGLGSRNPRVQLPLEIVSPLSGSGSDPEELPLELSDSVALGVPVVYSPDPDQKEPPATGWVVLAEDPGAAGGALDDFAAYSAMNSDSGSSFAAGDDDDPYVN